MVLTKLKAIRKSRIPPAGLCGSQLPNWSCHYCCCVEDSMIKTLGRWQSAAFLQYIRSPKTPLAAVSRTLARVCNMKNRLSKNSSMKIPVHYTCRGKLKTKIVAHKILPLKSCSALKFPQTVISIIFLH